MSVGYLVSTFYIKLFVDTMALSRILVNIVSSFYQEMRIGNLLPAQTGPHHLPGGFNGPGGPPFHGAHGIASGPPPFQNNAFVRPPMPLMGSSDPHNLSAEVYRQKHEVTATVCVLSETCGLT